MSSDCLQALFKKYGFCFSENELDLFLYGYHWQDGEDVNRPLSKHTYDIVKRLGVMSAELRL